MYSVLRTTTTQPNSLQGSQPCEIGWANRGKRSSSWKLRRTGSFWDNRSINQYLYMVHVHIVRTRSDKSTPFWNAPPIDIPLFLSSKPRTNYNYVSESAESDTLSLCFPSFFFYSPSFSWTEPWMYISARLSETSGTSVMNNRFPLQARGLMNHSLLFLLNLAPRFRCRRNDVRVGVSSKAPLD